MIAKVYIDPRLEKSLQALRRAGKKAGLAADQAEQIVARFCDGQRILQAGAVTKNGEMRIKGVIKYDLGSGYRLITFRYRRRLYLLYAGSHDDCHRWIENNRELALTIEAIRERCRRIVVPRRPPSDARTTSDDQSDAGIEGAPPEPEYDQRMLREVFAGLCGAAR